MVNWLSDGVPIDGTIYGGWTIECRKRNSATVLWTKSTGITGLAGSGCAPSIQISWLSNDLGSLDPGRYLLEVSGVVNGKSRKFQIDLEIIPEI